MELKVKKIFGLDWGLTQRLLLYVRKHVLLLVMGLGFLLLSDILSVLHPYLFKMGIDNYVMKNNLPGLRKITLIMAIVFLFLFLSQYLFNYLTQYLGQKLLYTIRMDLFKKVLVLGNDYFDRTPSGKILTNLTNDVEAIREFISNGIVTILGDSLKILFIVAMMFFIHVKLALISFITIPLFILATALFRRSIRTGFRMVRKANAEINTDFVESLNGIKEIKIFDYRDRAAENFDQKNKKYLNAYLKIVRTYALYFPSIELVANISMILILFTAHFYIGISFKVGVIFSFFAYLNMFFRPLRELAEKFNMFQSAMAAAERIFRLLDEPVSIINNPKAKSIPNKLQGKIEFQNVYFSYDGKKDVLHDVNFIIKPKQKVAFVGRTGSGKTTITKLIARLYDIHKGKIFLDDVPIRDYDLYDLRKNIAVIPQEPMIFSGNVIENIRLFETDITREEVERAAREVHAHEFIMKLPKGYETDLLEGGKMLSTGQKQLISMARAFLKQPYIVILDEATANIDSETEKLLEKGLQRLMLDRTSIIIAHRLASIQYVDVIYVLKEGRIVEIGNHDELIKKGGIYYKLYQTQSLLQEI